MFLTSYCYHIIYYYHRTHTFTNCVVWVKCCCIEFCRIIFRASLLGVDTQTLSVLPDELANGLACVYILYKQGLVRRIVSAVYAKETDRDDSLWPNRVELNTMSLFTACICRGRSSCGQTSDNGTVGSCVDVQRPVMHSHVSRCSCL